MINLSNPFCRFLTAGSIFFESAPNLRQHILQMVHIYNFTYILGQELGHQTYSLLSINTYRVHVSKRLRRLLRWQHKQKHHVFTFSSKKATRKFRHHQRSYKRYWWVDLKLHYSSLYTFPFKGTVPRDFRVFFFLHESVSPKQYHYGHFEFFRKFAEIFAAQGAPPVSLTPVANGKNLQSEKF